MSEKIQENKVVGILAYDYKRAGLKRIKTEGIVEYEKAADRYVLKMGNKLLGYYYPKDEVTKDTSLNTVGKGNLLAGLVLLAQLLTDE